MRLDPRAVVLALGGTVTSRTAVLVPGPDHSQRDRSLSIKIDPAAQDGFIVHSFAGDCPVACREHVRAALDLGTQESRRRLSTPSRTHRSAPSIDEDASERSAFALRLWSEAHDPRGTIVENYLVSRGLALTNNFAGHAIRFHPALKLDGVLVGAMVALFRDLATDEPCGIHRTFLDSASRKFERRMLGRAKHAAIKVDADENVTLGLTIGEGLETCVAARLAGFSPVWSVGSVGAIAAFPVLSGIEAITILGESGDGGANFRAAQSCAQRWNKAEREALVVQPLVGADLNDVWREVVQ